jgi:hypothetical protein
MKKALKRFAHRRIVVNHSNQTAEFSHVFVLLHTRNNQHWR